ncbi:MAG: hypothetical protein AAF493_10855 [Pseudomonadota bacterium]
MVSPTNETSATRRSFLFYVVGIATAALTHSIAHAHSPYRQWGIYRRRHLMIGTSRENEPTYELGRQLVETLAELLPESAARVTRARTVYRLASLLAANQLALALLTAEDAMKIIEGTGRFESIGPTALHSLAQIAGFQLVSDQNFPAHHAWRVSRTFIEHPSRFPNTAVVPPTTVALRLHPGSEAARNGLPQPNAPESDPIPAQYALRGWCRRSFRAVASRVSTLCAIDRVRIVAGDPGMLERTPAGFLRHPTPCRRVTILSSAGVALNKP